MVEEEVSVDDEGRIVGCFVDYDGNERLRFSGRGWVSSRTMEWRREEG